jgi:spore coat polysaccharide biosynthesis predicted glycosyltransferase SpsG
VTSVALRCDGSRELGLGHVVRCLAVADELRALGADVVLASRPDSVALELAARADHALAEPEAVADADVALFDIRDGTGRAHLEALRETGTVVAVLDDGSERRLAADVAFYPPVPRVGRLDWLGFDGTLHWGWEWIALRAAFADAPPRPRRPRPRVLVAAGGSDPAGLTLRAVRALELVDLDLDPVVMLGAGFARRDELDAVLAAARRTYALVVDPHDVAGTMAAADVAIASFGVTAYELAALQVPAVHLCLTDDHADSATALDAAGVARSLGRHDLVADAELADAIGALAAAPPEVPRLVDGLGAARIARELLAVADRGRASFPRLERISR